MSKLQGCQRWNESPIIPDENGWYRVQLGCFGLNDSTGRFTHLVKKEVFDQLQDRMSKQGGSIYGELRKPNMTASDRVSINLDRIAFKLRDIEVVEEDMGGQPIQKVYGLIQSAGSFKAILLNALTTSDNKLIFGYRAVSIPSFSLEDVESRRLVIEITDFVTFDLLP